MSSNFHKKTTDQSQGKLSPDHSDSILTIPNYFSFFRLAGSFVLIFVALYEMPNLFLALFVALILTDWIDGKLAVYLNQKTIFGATLDSLADATMYGALIFGTSWLKWDVIVRESPWLIAVVVSYGLTSLAGLVKYGRIPSYHTRAAKTCWLLVGIAVISVFAELSVWPLRIASVAVVLTNLEAFGMTLVLPEWRAEVRSLHHAVQIRKGEEDT